MILWSIRIKLWAANQYDVLISGPSSLNINTHLWSLSFPGSCKLLVGSASPVNYKTQERRRPSCESIVFILGANLRATALPEACGVIRTSTVLVTYLVTNSVWHEARWDMGRKKEPVNRPLKCIPKPVHFTGTEEEEEEEEERQKECDDTVWRMYSTAETGGRDGSK